MRSAWRVPMIVAASPLQRGTAPKDGEDAAADTPAGANITGDMAPGARQ